MILDSGGVVGGVVVSDRDDIEDLTRELNDAVVRELGEDALRLELRDLSSEKRYLPQPEDEPVVEPEGW